MAIYDSTVKRIGTDIRAGLESIAKAIENRQSVTYNVIVNTAATDPEEIAKAAQAALERTQKREKALGTV
jgi:hypothetical protein